MSSTCHRLVTSSKASHPKIENLAHASPQQLQPQTHFLRVRNITATSDSGNRWPHSTITLPFRTHGDDPPDFLFHFPHGSKLLPARALLSVSSGEPSYVCGCLVHNGPVH
jgi:hypothetical protein